MEQFINICIGMTLSFVFLFIVFIPMEKAFPAKKEQRIFRGQWWLDLTFFVGQYLIWNALILICLEFSQGYIQSWMPISWQVSIQSQPFWLQVLEVLLLSDFLIYWAHRCQHNNAFLWQFHKVHHSVKELDWLAAHREHPLDTIYTVGIINLPAIVLGFNIDSIIAFVAFRGIWAIFIHSNVRLNIGPLKYFIGSPDLHHWHHDLDRKTGNYANISPLMDLLFGTYYCPNKEPDAFGIEEETPNNYIRQLVEPMLPKKWWRKSR